MLGKGTRATITSLDSPSLEIVTTVHVGINKVFLCYSAFVTNKDVSLSASKWSKTCMYRRNSVHSNQLNFGRLLHHLYTLVLCLSKLPAFFNFFCGLSC